MASWLRPAWTRFASSMAPLCRNWPLGPVWAVVFQSALVNSSVTASPEAPARQRQKDDPREIGEGHAFDFCFVDQANQGASVAKSRRAYLGQLALIVGPLGCKKLLVAHYGDVKLAAASALGAFPLDAIVNPPKEEQVALELTDYEV